MTIKVVHPGFVVICDWKKCGGVIAVTSVREIHIAVTQLFQADGCCSRESDWL